MYISFDANRDKSQVLTGETKARHYTERGNKINLKTKGLTSFVCCVAVNTRTLSVCLLVSPHEIDK